MLDPLAALSRLTPHAYCQPIVMYISDTLGEACMNHPSNNPPNKYHRILTLRTCKKQGRSAPQMALSLHRGTCASASRRWSLLRCSNHSTILKAAGESKLTGSPNFQSASLGWWQHRVDNSIAAMWPHHDPVVLSVVLSCLCTFVAVSYTHLTLPTKRIV